MQEDYVGVTVLPLDDDSSFAIEMMVLDRAIHPESFKILLNFSLEEDEIPGLNEDAKNNPDQLLDLAKGLLLCDSEEMPDLYEIPEEERPEESLGFFYDIEIEMELSDEATGRVELKNQAWEVAILHSGIDKPLEPPVLFEMIQNFFKNHI